MSDLLKDFDLTRDPFNVLLVLNAGFLENFDGHVFFRQYMMSHFDFAECALSEGLTYTINISDQKRNLKE